MNSARRLVLARAGQVPRLVALVVVVCMALTLTVTARTTLAASPILVTTSADVIASDGVCSLREAITAANTNAPYYDCGSNRAADFDSIAFNIAGNAAPCIITLTSPLPAISEAVVIDGYSQPGAQPNSAANGSNATVLITLDGDGRINNGLTITGNGSSVRGLAIGRFSNAGIVLQNGGNNTIAGNYIGTDASGLSARPNRWFGISIQNSANNLIGGTTPQSRNVISGNAFDGIVIQQNGATANRILGNYIGVDKSGVTALGNAQNGVDIQAPANVVGQPGAGNVIGANGNVGIAFQLAASRATTVQANLVGVAVDGATALGNRYAGIDIYYDGGGHTIGGSSPGAGNLIVYNGTVGIRVLSPNNRFEGNTIRKNASDGILVQSGGNTIGSDTTNGGNLISANGASKEGGAGIKIVSAGTSANRIQGNLIGTDASGSSADGNSCSGISIADTAGTIIGGTTAAARNVIAGNREQGISLSGSTVRNTLIQGNFIGTDASGARALPNLQNGIAISNNASANNINANTIANNTGDGVLIESGTGNRISGNSIFANGALGIDLAPDGVTANDVGDGDGGANQGQNTPTIEHITTVEGNTTILGTLNSRPGQQYTIEFFADTSCDTSGSGEGRRFLGAASSTTNSDGNGSFSFTNRSGLLDGLFISATATDAAGNTSEFAACKVPATNDNWVNAQPITLTPSGPSQTSATVSQTISQPYQTRWYRFPATPGGRVHLTLNSAAGSNVTLHTDIQKVYNQLGDPQNAAALAVNDLPSGFLPSGFLPSGFLPSGFLPSGFLPSGFLPSGFLPSGFLPSGFLPSGFLPSGFLPSGFLPSGFLPEQYSGAVYRSLIAIAADPDATVQTIDRNSWDLAEDLYVRVAGPVSDTPFTLEITFESGLCGNISAAPSNVPTIAGAQPTADSLNTLIVWDSQRMASADPSGNMAALAAKLAGFAARPEIHGAVIDLAALDGSATKYPRVAFAQQQADQNTACSEAKNLAANEIKAVIDSYRAANLLANGTTSLKYIVLVGGDAEIPFFRSPDTAGLASESEYYPPVRDDSASNASLRQGRVLGQDAYGAQYFLRRGSYSLAIPDLAVGRLVRTAADVTKLIDNYVAANGRIVPQSALVTGYDFVADAAEGVRDQLTLGLNQPGCTNCLTPATLIQPVGEAPTGPHAWTADQLRAQLLNQRHDLVFFTGHFAAGSMLAADYQSSLLASEIDGAPADFTNTILFGLGCHSGYNIPQQDGVSGFTPDPDWPEAFARRGATFIAATGFAYGDTELTEYGERLLLQMSRELRTGNGPVALGQALAAAKQQYLSEKLNLSGLDEKTLVQFSLYGLPMLAVDMPGQRLQAATSSGLVSGAAAVGSGPGQSFGLKLGQSGANPFVLVTPSLTRKNVQLTSTDGSGAVTSSYWQGKDGVLANPIEPILPLERYNVAVSGQILRGIGFRGGTYSDEQPITPLTTAPTTDASRGHPAFFSDTFYPAQTWGANHFDALNGGGSQLLVTPAQYQSSGIGATSGRMRLYSDLQFKLYYIDESWPAGSAALRAAAVAAAPEIRNVGVTYLPNGNVAISADALGDASVGVQEVWLTYTDPNAPAPKRWQSIDLVRSASDANHWETAAGGVGLPVGALFMVQATNGAGLVSVDTKLGAYYAIPPQVVTPPPPAVATAFQVLSGGAAGAYGTTATFGVQLRTTAGAAVANQVISLAIGGRLVYATTDATGTANVSTQLSLPIGSYPARFAFSGAPGFERTTLTFDFAIVKDATNLALNTSGPSSVLIGTSTGIAATLRDSANRPIADRSVTFVASGTNGTFGQTITTGQDGQAILGIVAWPIGSYSVQAFFGGTVPLPGGASFTDALYNPSQSAIIALTIRPLDTTPPITSARVAGTLVRAPDVFAPGAMLTLSSNEAGITQYRIQPFGGSFSAWQTYSGPVSITGEGTNTIEFFSIDAANNREDTKAVVVKISTFGMNSILDNFNRTATALSSNWSGASGASSYRIIQNQRVDTVAGGAIYWKAGTGFGTTQTAFVTLTSIDRNGREHNLLLKVQGGSKPDWQSGAIEVLYDARANGGAGAVRLETFRPNRTAWNIYDNIPLSLSNGDQLGARVLANGEVWIYKNAVLVARVTLSAADQAFFNSKGGRIGLWMEQAGNAEFDDFGGS